MITPLDLPRLHDLCGSALPALGGGARAAAIVEELGHLGHLWLRDAVLSRARAWRCELNGEPSIPPFVRPQVERGQIGILLALDDASTLPLLEPAFVLPVEWREGGPPSARLPLGLAGMAERVLADVGARGLSLHLADRGLDLSGLQFSCDSAWAALAAGAIVAAERGVTQPDVLVSAAWKPESDQSRRGRIRKVGTVAEKLAAAKTAGARTVFLPEGHRDECDDLPAAHPARGLDVRYLPHAPMKPARAIAAVLQAMEAAPRRESGADLEQRSRYFLRAARDRQNAYYCEELLDEIAGRLRDTPTAHGLGRVDGVVLIGSQNWGLACLVAAVFPGADVLLLHDGDLADRIDEIERRLRSIDRPPLPARSVHIAACRTGDGFAEDARQALSRFAAGRSRVAVDMTGGYRHYMFALLDALPGNAVATCIATEYDREHAVFRPQTASILVLGMEGRAAL